MPTAYEIYVTIRALLICIGIPVLILWLLVHPRPKQGHSPRKREKIDPRRTYGVRRTTTDDKLAEFFNDIEEKHNMDMYH